MRKIIFIAPEWLATDEDESVLRQNLPGLARMAERGTIYKLAPLPRSETPEAQVLGLMPGQTDLAQGPLTIAALGADPPERSTHFHLTPMSVQDGVLYKHQLELPPEQVDLVMARAKILNTKSLTIVPGEGLDHGLVWEGVGDLGTTAASEGHGKPYATILPQGDNEPAMRRFIDDSVNLLAELEFNEERIDQGLAPVNILWPWGQGVRLPIPNLALKRGEPIEVISPSLRLSGLTRLAGYRHAPRTLLARGLNADWRSLAAKALDGRTTLIWTPVFEELRTAGKIEEASWLTKEIDERFIDPILESAVDTPTHLSILMPSATSEGLGSSFESNVNTGGHVPFDERALDEKLASRHLHEDVARLLSPS